MCYSEHVDKKEVVIDLKIDNRMPDKGFKSNAEPLLSEGDNYKSNKSNRNIVIVEDFNKS